MDQANFPQVYSDYRDMIWKLISRYVRRPADREDLFQEIALKIHASLKNFRGESQLETWIYRIAVNASINFLKKQDRHKRLVEVLKVFRHIEEADESEDFEKEKVLKPLEKLNPQQRMILMMSDVEERKLEDISQMLKLPIGTVKSNLHRAREIVKKEVMKNEGI
jgi:RNA polymerase sigma-70 factor, ECF subfamily